MERRKFVKRTAILATGILAFSEMNLFASEAEKKQSEIDLSPFLKSEGKIVIKGFIKDFETLLPIANVKMEVAVKRNRFFPLNKELHSVDGSYCINSCFTNSKKAEIIQIKIVASGYKTYQGKLYSTRQGIYLHSNDWSYNPNFNPEKCPKNNMSDNAILSTFNFHLIKA